MDRGRERGSLWVRVDLYNLATAWGGKKRREKSITSVGSHVSKVAA